MDFARVEAFGQVGYNYSYSMKKLSIIIPIYKTEQWISRCLDSCLKQDFPTSDYELIIVNDGTPDNAMQVVAQYVAQYDNVRIVEQANAGLSAARNSGIDVAQGEYVWFVDSDDFIEPHSIGQLTKIVSDNKLDVLCFGLYLYYSSAHYEKFLIPHSAQQKVFDGSDFLCNVDMPPAAWCALYRRSFLNDNELRFKVGIVHEDLEFTPRAYYLAQRIMFVDAPVYNYYQREGSLMKSKNQKRSSDFLCVADSLYNFVQKKVNGEKVKNIFNQKIAFVFSQSLSFCNEYDKKTIAIYTSKPYYPLQYDQHISFRDRLKYATINFSVTLYLWLYKLLK